jgi:predicted phage terminase large subunit-like protein
VNKPLPKGLIGIPEEKHAEISRRAMERSLEIIEEMKKRKRKKLHAKSFYEFVKWHWPTLEPETKLIDGWALQAICEHLQATAEGKIRRIHINVPPGFMKSLLTNVFFPAWCWGPFNRPHWRFLSFSYAASLTARDNRKLSAVLNSYPYQLDWGDTFEILKDGESLITNSITGWKLATSVGGVSTGERGDFILADDLHNVKEGESKTIRTNTTTWFREAMQNRLNSIKNSRVIVIMQRVNEEDVSGVILNNDMDYEHLMIPMEYDPNRHCETKIGWEDPRTEEGELAWPERFDEEDCAKLKNDIGEYAWAGQYQQTPEVRGGGIFKREWWQLWEERTYPTFDYIVAYLDPAYTEKEENDPSAMTIWGVFKKNGLPKIMLIYAWEKREELHGLVNETFKAAKKWQSDILLIENKASGISVSQEIRRLYVGAPFAVRLDEPEGDKVARAHAASHVWEQGMVYVPTIDGEVVDWAQKVIDHMAVFPKGSHDDITDTATGAVRFLRRMGLLERSDELQEQASSEMAYQSGKYVTKPLYPC